MPTFKIINDDGSVSEYKPSPKIPVKQVDSINRVAPKVYPKNPAPKPIKVYPKASVEKESNLDSTAVTGVALLNTNTESNDAVIPPLAESVAKPVAPLYDESPVTEVPSSVEEKAPTIKVTTSSSDAMIFSPIVKGKHAKQVQASASDDKMYAIDQKGMDSLINAIADTLSDKFVSKDEVSSVVSSVIQGMVVPNSVK